MKKLKTHLQSFIIMLLMFLGAYYLYTYIWMLLALPAAWWTSLILAIVSILSVWGLVVWVSRG